MYTLRNPRELKYYVLRFYMLLTFLEQEGLREKKLAWCSKDLLEMCEEQCNIVPSGVSKRQIYTATTHQLLCLDLRRGFSQRWTHLMTSPPHLAFAHRAINK